MPDNKDINNRFAAQLATLESSGNLRTFHHVDRPGIIDFTSNDYMGIAERTALRDDFLATIPASSLSLTSSASRLLVIDQTPYWSLENRLADLYGRPALLFNSGYHANTGIISAIADKNSVIIADRLAHASILDGISLAKSRFERFRHNDYDHLERLINKYESTDCTEILVIVESVYSMDGDCADIDLLIDLKRRHLKLMLYVDEAHAFGCEGPAGLGLVAASKAPHEVDFVIVTLGKAAASQGAFVICDEIMKQYLVNRSRSLIFSTAIPPISAAWSRYVIDRLIDLDTERQHLHQLAATVAHAFSRLGQISFSTTAIQPFIVGNAAATISLSESLANDGLLVLPIRTPTVPPGTERLRISLSAARSTNEINKLINSLTAHYEAVIRN